MYLYPLHIYDYKIIALSFSIINTNAKKKELKNVKIDSLLIFLIKI